MGSEYISDFEIVAVYPPQKTQNVLDAIEDQTGYVFDGMRLNDETFYEAEAALAGITGALSVKVEMIRMGQEHEYEKFFAANGTVTRVPAKISFPVPEWYAGVEVQSPPELEIDEGSWRVYVANNNKVKLVFVAAENAGKYQEERFLIAEDGRTHFDTAKHAKNTYARSAVMAEHYFKITNKPPKAK